MKHSSKQTHTKWLLGGAALVGVTLLVLWKTGVVPLAGQAVNYELSEANDGSWYEDYNEEQYQGYAYNSPRSPDLDIDLKLTTAPPEGNLEYNASGTDTIVFNVGNLGQKTTPEDHSVLVQIQVHNNVFSSLTLWKLFQLNDWSCRTIVPDIQGIDSELTSMDEASENQYIICRYTKQLRGGTFTEKISIPFRVPAEEYCGTKYPINIKLLHNSVPFTHALTEGEDGYEFKYDASSNQMRFHLKDANRANNQSIFTVTRHCLENDGVEEDDSYEMYLDDGGSEDEDPSDGAYESYDQY